MKLPKQTAPVNRSDVLNPHFTVNIQDASKNRAMEIQFDLQHGANYNDPMRFLVEYGFHGCHIFSEYSRATCLAIYGLL